MNALVINRLLGWFSFALGLLEVAAPRTIARNLGVPGGGALICGFGLRELIAGAAILGKPWSPLGPWSRVAGDAMDLTTLAMALGPRNRNRGAAGAAIIMVAAVTALDLMCAISLTQRGNTALATARRSRYVPKVDASGMPTHGSVHPG